MFEKFQSIWKRNLMAKLSKMAAASAFILWAAPTTLFGISFNQYSCENGTSGGGAYSLFVVQVISGCLDDRYDQIIVADGWFTLERLPAIAISLTLGALLFCVSVWRRGRAKRMTRSRAPQTLVVAFVSATVSALVVAGAGFFLITQTPAKRTVFQSVYASPTPSPQLFPTITPTPTVEAPKPTTVPIKKLSERELLQINSWKESLALAQERIARAEAAHWAFPWPLQISAIKMTYTNSNVVFAYTLTRGIPINPDNPYELVPFKLTAKCVHTRSNFSSELSGGYSSVYVTFEEYDSSASLAYPFEPQKWKTKYKYEATAAAEYGGEQRSNFGDFYDRNHNPLEWGDGIDEIWTFGGLWRSIVVCDFLW